MSTLKRHDNAKENASSVHDFLDEIAREDGLEESPYLSALLNDATGLLASISQGIITSGQPRIVDRLVEIVHNYPDGKDPTNLIEAIAACSERGLSAAEHTLSAGLGHRR